jgi:diamine N-acetyltransferase
MLTIRQASAADIDALVPLKAAVHALHVEARPDIFKAMQADELASWLRQQFAEPTADVWLAEEEGQPVGYVIANRQQREETPFSFARQWCQIDEVAVDPRWRRRGIARALLQRAIARARESGLTAVELSTWAFNEPARAAFARKGFAPMVIRYELGARSGS